MSERQASGKSRSSPLLKPDWRYLEHDELEAFGAADWALLDRQRKVFMAERQVTEAFDMLRASAEAPTFGYRINNFRHCLQSATMAHRDGLDEETVVVCLFHDIGFIVSPEGHGEMAAALLGPYVCEANHWMLRRHAIFQQKHVHGHPDLDPDARERWRGHPHFEWTATFVARYDQNAIRPDYEEAPLDFFEPMARRLFARPPRALPID